MRRGPRGRLRGLAAACHSTYERPMRLKLRQKHTHSSFKLFDSTNSGCSINRNINDNISNDNDSQGWVICQGGRVSQGHTFYHAVCCVGAERGDPTPSCTSRSPIPPPSSLPLTKYFRSLASLQTHMPTPSTHSRPHPRFFYLSSPQPFLHPVSSTYHFYT